MNYDKQLLPSSHENMQLPTDPEQIMRVCDHYRAWAERNPDEARAGLELAMMDLDMPPAKTPEKPGPIKEDKAASKLVEKAGKELPITLTEQSIVAASATEKPNAANVKPEVVIPKAEVQRKPKISVEKPLTQMEQAMRHMQQVQEEETAARTPQLKPEASSKKDAPAKQVEHAVTKKPAAEVPAHKASVVRSERHSTDIITEKIVEVPAVAAEPAVLQVPEAAEIGIGLLHETAEYELFEDVVSPAELPMAAEAEAEPELDYEALFQEMVAELVTPSTEAEEAADPEGVWPEGTFALDGTEELLVEVQQAPEAPMLVLPEVSDHEFMPEITLPALATPEPSAPFETVVSDVFAAPESAGKLEEAVDEPALALQGIYRPDIDAHKPFVAAMEDAERPEPDETAELDYRAAESLFSIMRELMWSPSTSDFAAHSGSAGHRLGQLLVQLIAGRIDAMSAKARA